MAVRITYPITSITISSVTLHIVGPVTGLENGAEHQTVVTGLQGSFAMVTDMVPRTVGRVGEVAKLLRTWKVVLRFIWLLNNLHSPTGDHRRQDQSCAESKERKKSKMRTMRTQDKVNQTATN